MEKGFFSIVYHNLQNRLAPRRRATESVVFAAQSQYALDVTRCVQHTDHLEWFTPRPIDNQVGIDQEKRCL